MTLKHKFKLETVADGTKIVMALQVHRCNQVGSPDEWQQYILDPDELDDLRRVLDIGMGDCDHCVAWKLYIDGQITQTGNERDATIRAKENHQNIISHDMTRFENRLTGIASNVTHHIKRHDTDIENLREHHMRDAKRIAKLEDDTRLEAVESESSNALAGFHTLAKLIDDLKVDLERVKTDMAVMKFALTTHMGMSHEQDK